MQIHINKDGQPYGPFTIDQLKEYVQQGHFTEQDYACYDGQNWVTVAQVPGYAGGAGAQPQQPQQDVQAQTQASDQQAQAVAHHQAQVVEARAIAAAATAAAAKKKKIILFSSIGGVAACLIVGLLIWAPWSGGDDENEDNTEVASGESGDDADKSTPAAITPATPTASLPLEKYIPTNAAGAFVLPVKQIVEKVGIDSLAEMVPPPFNLILENYQQQGVDFAEPIQAFLILDADDPNQPTFGALIRLSDPQKFQKGLVPLVTQGAQPTSKDGYDEYALGNGSDAGLLVVAGDVALVLGGEGKAENLPSLAKNIITSDGSDSFAKARYGYEDFVEEGHDLGFWFDLNKISEASPEEIPSEAATLLKGGTGAVYLDFVDGEASIAGEFHLAETAPKLGRGGLSVDVIKLIPSDSLAAISLALDMKAIERFIEEVVVPTAKAEGEEINLDEIDPNIGIKPRDVIQAFKGEFSLAVTDFAIPDGGSDVPLQDAPAVSETPGGDPFGGAKEAPGDPFGEPSVTPFPGAGAADGPNEEGADIGDGAPQVEFLFAATIDPAKWETLKTSPPIGMAMGGAMLMGFSVIAENGKLIVASKKHADEAKAGKVSKTVSGAELDLFQKNDFVLKFDLAKAAQMKDTPIPPPVFKALEKLSYLAITGTSNEKGGSGALRIGMADKNKNSLASFMELIPMLQALGGGMDVPSSAPDEGEPDFEDAPNF